MRRAALAAALALLGAGESSAAGAPFDAAAAFGARPSVGHMRLSPDGKSIAYIAPGPGQGSALSTLSLAADSKSRIALRASGKPERLTGCDWVANDRLACEVYFIGPPPDRLPFSRLIAVNADGSNVQLLSKPRNWYARGVHLSGDEIIDWLPEQDGTVLMKRVVLADDHLGSRAGSSEHGLGVDRIDTRSLATSKVLPPVPEASDYITDGHGAVRIMAEAVFTGDQQLSGGIRYLYRPKNGSGWRALSRYNSVDETGFLPLAVDRDLDVAYGWDKKDGRRALFSMSLDGSARETLLYARDDVDLDGLMQVGRHQRVVGVGYSTEYPDIKYIDPAMEQLMGALQKALPTRTVLWVTDATADESKLLIFSAGDVDAGVYYLFDRPAHQLQTLLVARSPLEGVKLASVRPITYPAHDGVGIPGYLTLPPGKEDAKGLPAIVLPHGGPGYRDSWGFDWLAQFFAARGYAVLQPNFRGSSGYGDAWFRDHAYKDWPVAIGDVLDAGRWLLKQGIADPGRLAVVGWSYGGYAALQSVVLDQDVFKAAVAIAPVTDLAALTEQYRDWTNHSLARDFIGPHVKDGSPDEHAGRIKVPVLLFHGTNDINVRYIQSQMMDRALTSAGVRHELVTFDGLDHGLQDSQARTEVLRHSDAFLSAAFAH